MLQDNELKSIFVDFCKQKREQCNLNEKSYQKLIKNVFVIYNILISYEKHVYLSLLESKLSFELYQYVLAFEYNFVYKNYGSHLWDSHFWSYSGYLGVITEKDIFECLDLGIEFYEPQDDYFYDYEYDSYIYCDTLFENKGSKQKQYYLIQRSNK